MSTDSSQAARVYRFGSSAVGVESDDRAILDWLDEFLTPWFEIAGGAEADYHLAFRVDPDAYRRACVAIRDTAGRTAGCFVLDGGVARYPLWLEAEGRRMVLNDEHAAVYTIEPDARHVRVLAATADGAPRMALMRVVRELAIIHGRRQGHLLLHASAFEIAGRVVVLAGPKRSGKTTLLLHVLHCGGARFVANDRVVVRDPAVVAGMPTVASVRDGTLGMLPALALRFRASLDHCRLTLAEAERASRTWDPRPGLSPAQLCRLLEVEPTREGSIASIVFPEVTEDRRELRLEPLSPERAGARLVAALLGDPGALESAELWLGSHAGMLTDHEALEETCRDLAKRVTCFTCYLGVDAYRSSESADELIARTLTRCS